MRRILKQAIPNRPGPFTLMLPVNEGQALGVQVQNDKPVLYYIGDKDSDHGEFQFIAYETGDVIAENIQVPNTREFLGTAMLNETNYVLHYFCF